MDWRHLIWLYLKYVRKMRSESLSIHISFARQIAHIFFCVYQ